MKMILTSLLLPMMALVACRSTAEEKTNTSPLPGWLAGTWISASDSITFAEQWNIVNDSLFSGRGFALMGTDTLFSEQLQIKKIGDTLYYIPTVADQNSGQPVQFKMTSVNDSGFIAVNPAHDFPQEIRYTLKGDSLYAILTGVENGKERSELFAMKKKN